MNYYSIAKKASSEVGGHQGLRYLREICKTSKKILDVGCGEGTRLKTLLPDTKNGWGVDSSVKAITLAKKRYPGFHFSSGNGESLAFPDNSFDLVYSAFAIEHCMNPQEFITQMIRVCKPGGKIVILSPNYGAPNRRSPNSVQNPYQKFFDGLIKDIFPYPGLGWTQVTPQDTYTQIDADTTWEPYLHSLIDYFIRNNIKVTKYSSLWNLEPEKNLLRQKVIKLFGQLGIWPFKYWGPQLFITGVK